MSAPTITVCPVKWDVFIDLASAAPELAAVVEMTDERVYSVEIKTRVVSDCWRDLAHAIAKAIEQGDSA